MSELNDPQASIFPGLEVDASQLAPYGPCACMSCVGKAMTKSWDEHEAMLNRGEIPAKLPLTRPFIVCPTCSNKRCPKATLHSNTCTGSNEYGQPGSIYGGLDGLDPKENA